MRKQGKKVVFYWVLLLIGVGMYSFFIGFDKTEANVSVIETLPPIAEPKPKPQDKMVRIDIGPEATFGELMRENGVDYGVAMAMYAASQDVYDLVRIRQGRTLDLRYDPAGIDLKELRYQIDTEEYLFVRASTTADASTTPLSAEYWSAIRANIPYETRIRTAAGVVETSMYEAASSSDIDIRAIIELANAFQWSIDFAMDPRVGDTFKFIYEERYLDGEYVMPGQIFAGKYINDGTVHELYYFEEDEDNIGFFDAEGRSVQKMFLKAPVEFKYISSGYTTGNRVIMEFGLSGPHRAIDYAAPIGTPIRTVGDGTVVFAGWKTGYGYMTSVRHNGTYTTNYAHQSRLAVSYGQKVIQGETIGYVGSTGYSTGPHLHYEMVKNGAKINPLNEILPPGKPIKEENMQRFRDTIKDWQAALNQ